MKLYKHKETLIKKIEITYTYQHPEECEGHIEEMYNDGFKYNFLNQANEYEDLEVMFTKEVVVENKNIFG